MVEPEVRINAPTQESADIEMQGADEVEAAQDGTEDAGGEDDTKAQEPVKRTPFVE